MTTTHVPSKQPFPPTNPSASTGVAAGTRRTTLAAIRRLLQGHPSWRILDAGGGATPWPEATARIDLREAARPRPGGFDFVIAERVLECVHDPLAACFELTRLAPRGYIEVVTPLFHNLVRDHQAQQRHWATFDDESATLVFRPARSVLPDLFSAAHFEALRTAFPESTVTRLFWEGTLEVRLENLAP